MKKFLTMARIIFGWIYFVIHALMLAFAGVYIFLSLTVSPSGPEVIPLVLIPLLGLFVGHWIRKARFGAWRIALMVVSLLFSSAVVYLAFLLQIAVTPASHKPEEESFHKPALSKSILMIDAAQRNDLAGVKANLKAGAKINAQDGQGNTALHIAALEGFKDIAQFLIDSGADANIRDEFGQTPLHVVKSPAIAAMLIQHGADVNARDSQFLMSPIFSQDIEIAKLLVAAGAQIDIKGKKGSTPLIWHAYNNYKEGIEFLLAHGADINTVNDEDSTALDIVLRFDNRDLAEFLRSRGGKTAEDVRRGLHQK